VGSLDENPNCARTYATFRLAGDTLKPDEVSAALGLTPTHAVAKRRQRTGVWLKALRREHELRGDFFCYWLSASGHGGPEVSPTTLARIAALDLSLGIDFYGPLEDSG
jgi:hypothetical protein